MTLPETEPETIDPTAPLNDAALPEPLLRIGEQDRARLSEALRIAPPPHTCISILSPPTVPSAA